jgi:hypothetical protein
MVKKAPEPVDVQVGQMIKAQRMASGRLYRAPPAAGTPKLIHSAASAVAQLPGLRPPPRDPHDDPGERSQRDRAPPPIPTLESFSPPWVWIDCTNTAANCHHSAPMAVTPLVIRWGFGTSSDKLRASARCTKCGHKGASLRAPSWKDSVVGVQPFPVGRR